MNEMELVRQLQTGSRTAFDQIYEQYHVQAYRTAVLLTGNRADGGDCLSRLIGKEERERIRKAVESLDEKHRSIVVLYYFNDFTTAEIARITGCFEGTVKSRLHAARKKLGKRLSDNEAGGKLLRAVSHAE